jgi:hypothetical protein
MDINASHWRKVKPFQAKFALDEEVLVPVPDGQASADVRDEFRWRRLHGLKAGRRGVVG